MVLTDNKVELKITGRDGELIYSDGQRSASAYVELSGSSDYDLLVSTLEIKSWSDGNPVTKDDLNIISEAFKQWATDTKTRCQW